ncbi:hypothetical protein ABZ864_25150 [Streptomyces sp. NPDC047082]|uniref:hypothetical protein n=1 Tax=Streptomyces sp. NPDC047082 TaxID=3155259 RepID=UPI0033ECD690
MRRDTSDTNRQTLPRGTVYLSALDRQAESFIDPPQRKSVLERSLLSNLLFETAVLIPDIFFFISSGLADHIKCAVDENRESLIGASIAEGVAVSAFRDTDCNDFKTAYETVRDTGIRGLLAPEVCKQIARQLDISARSGKESQDFASTPWPTESVGAMYEQRLASFLQPEGDVPPAETRQIIKLWNDTHHWRHESFDNARARDDSGFRRGSYMAALGESVGLRGAPVDDIGQLFNEVRDPERLLALKVLCYWMNECYSYNQARAFGVMPNFPNFHPELSQVMLTSLEVSGVDNPTGITETTVTARIPPPRVLLGMDPRRLIRVRKQTAGAEYFAALNEWRGDPLNESLRREVETLFKAYARALRMEAAQGSRYTETLLRLKLAHFEGPARKLGAAAAVAASALLSPQIPQFAPYIALGSFGYATYVWTLDRARRHQHALKAELEVTLPQE